MERTWEFPYRNCQIALHVREADTESSTGIYLATIVCRPLQADGSAGPETVLERNHQSIHLGIEAACRAAEARARKRLDRQG